MSPFFEFFHRLWGKAKHGKSIMENILYNDFSDLDRTKSRIAWGIGFVLSSFVISFFHYQKNNDFHLYNSVSSNNIEPTQVTLSYIAPLPKAIEWVTPPQSNPFEKQEEKEFSTVIRLRPQQTFSSMLKAYGLPLGNVNKITSALNKVSPLARLKVGTRFNVLIEENPDFDFTNVNDFPHRLKSISYNAKAGIILEANLKDGEYVIEEKYTPIVKHQLLKEGTVSGSLYVSAQRAGIPVKMISQSIKKLSYTVDLRELQKGDKFEYAFDEYRDENGNIVGTGDLRYVSLIVGKKKHEYFYVTDKDGKSEIYDEKGSKAKSFLMKTPIDGARVSSGYGYRRHPVLGYTKLHQGIDFAAPVGTPIYASGDGVIVQQYFSSSYGNYVRIRHTGEYSTAYAHMSRFKLGNRVGMSVRQGQVIGYVGTTGRSTGPHLHYEVLKNNRQINPLTMTSVAMKVARPKPQIDYKKLRAEIESRRQGTIKPITYKSIKEIKEKIS